MNTKKVSFLRATFSIALVLLFVAGYATPYRPARGGEGYEDSQVAPDEFRVSYIVEYEQPRTYYRPGIRLLIRSFARKPDKPFTYDAAALEQSLKQRYRLG